MLKVYLYSGCSTCRQAVKWLTNANIAFEAIAIRETPPSIAELTGALSARNGDIRKLFNTSGQDYRALGLKDQLPNLSSAEALKLLSENGNLVKRPFGVDLVRSVFLVGFKPEEWSQTFA